MQHVAIDLGGKESQLCARATDGSIVKEARVSTRSLPKLLEAMEPSRVILETSAEAFLIADAALAHGHEVRVVPATLVRQLGVGARGIKTDRRDAQTLSEVSCRIDLPSVHIPSSLARKFKSLCGSREILVKTRTMLINKRPRVDADAADPDPHRLDAHVPAARSRVRPGEPDPRAGAHRASARGARRPQDPDQGSGPATGEAGGRAPGVPAADDRAGRGTSDGGPVRRRARRRVAVSERPRGPVVRGAGARRELEFGAEAAHRDHEGRGDGGPAGVDPGRLGGVPEGSEGADGGLGDADRRAPGRVHRDRRARQEARRDLVRDVAGRDDLPAVQERGGRAGVERPPPQEPPLSISGASCPTAVTAKRPVRPVGSPDEDRAANECSAAYGPVTAPRARIVDWDNLSPRTPPDNPRQLNREEAAARPSQKSSGQVKVRAGHDRHYIVGSLQRLATR